MDMDRIDADYVAIPELDTYDDNDLDRKEYGQMEFKDRRAAERELAERSVPSNSSSSISDASGSCGSCDAKRCFCSNVGRLLIWGIFGHLKPM